MTKNKSWNVAHIEKESGMTTKTEMKHTPGPWRVNFHNAGNIGSRDTCEIWCEDGSVALAKRIVRHAYGVNEKIERPLAEAKANAHLIAAAPEMLKALKLAQKYVSKMVADDVQTVVPPSHCLRVIESVILKAVPK